MQPVISNPEGVRNLSEHIKRFLPDVLVEMTEALGAWQ